MLRPAVSIGTSKLRPESAQCCHPVVPERPSGAPVVEVFDVTAINPALSDDVQSASSWSRHGFAPPIRPSMKVWADPDRQAPSHDPPQRPAHVGPMSIFRPEAALHLRIEWVGADAEIERCLFTREIARPGRQLR